MIRNKVGEELKYGGKRYYIGQVVYANNISDYAGLIGSIKEIRTGKDKDTENVTPDIYVSFDKPVGEDIKVYEDRFKRIFTKAITRRISTVNIRLIIIRCL